MAARKTPGEVNVAPFVWTFGARINNAGKVVPDTYEIDLTKMDVLALAALGRGDTMTGVRRLFTAEQYARLEASDTRFTNETLQDFLEKLTQHMAGVSVGESKASSRSSKSVTGPSKRTSAASTKSASRGSARKS